MYQHWQSATVHVQKKNKIRQSSKKCEISKAMDGIEDDHFQMDSSNSSYNNSEDHFSKKVQESFRKRRQGHPSYF